MAQSQLLEPKSHRSLKPDKESSPAFNDDFFAEIMRDEEFMAAPVVKKLATEMDDELISILKVNDKGWNVSLFENEMKISGDLLCAICKNVCVEAAELGCDHNDSDIHLYCNNCLRESIVANDGKCPINNHIDPVITLNRSIRRQISKSTVICPYSIQFKQRQLQNIKYTTNNDKQIIKNVSKGCIWKGTLEELKTDHLHKCTSINNLPFTVNKQKRIIQQLQNSNKELKANEDRLQTNLNAVEMKMIELKEQCNISVETIGRLRTENEDLHRKVVAIQDEIKSLEQTQQEEVEKLQQEIAKYQEEVECTKKQLHDLEENVTMNDDSQIEHLEKKNGEEIHYENQTLENEEKLINNEDGIDSTHTDIVDLPREYLHMTASVVKMKFPRVQHVSSEELISKVQNYPLWQYHDMMVRIMKQEEKKIIIKEKEQQNVNTTQQTDGMLNRFKSSINKMNAGNTQKGGTTNKKTFALKWKDINMGDAKRMVKAQTKKVSKKAMHLKDAAAKKLNEKRKQSNIETKRVYGTSSVPGIDDNEEESSKDDNQQNEVKSNNP